MRDDPRHRSLGLAAAALGILLCAVPAGAEGIYGSFTTQYQKVDETALLLTGGGNSRKVTLSQELWLRSLDLHQQSYLRPNLMLESNLRFSERSYLDRDDLARTPAGVMRLVHPYVQMMASHQPALTRVSLSSQSGLNRDSVTTRTVTTHNKESMVAGHFSFPNLPRVDLAWIERKRDGAGSLGDRNQTRSARVTFDRDRYSTYGTVNQQRILSGAAGSQTNIQTVLSAGGTYRYAARPNLSFNGQYDASDVLGSTGGARRPAIFSQSASLNGDWRGGSKWIGTSSMQWRRVDSGNRNLPAQTDHEGTLMGRYLFTRRSNLLSGLGYRTVRDGGGGISSTEGVQRYAMALASIDAPIRRKWTLSSNLSHTTNWDPGKAAYSVETLSGSTRGVLNPKLQADANLQVTANSDSSSAGSRYSSAWSARVQGTPLRALQLMLSVRNLRNGPGLLRPVAVARGVTFDVNWRPVRTLQLVGQYGWNDAAPSPAGRSTSRTVTARYEPARRWQWYGSWTRSDQREVVSIAGRLSSREVYATRLQFEPSRRFAANAALSYNDPGHELESRRLDLTLAWSFGR